MPSSLLIPKKSTSVISGPKSKKATELGIVKTPTVLIARKSCALTSSIFLFIANLDMCGKRAVTIEIVTIEYGSNIIRYAFLNGVKPTPVAIPALAL